MTPAPLRLVTLISGGGRTALNLLDRIEAGRLHATIELVISSRGSAAGVAQARDRGLPIFVPDRASYDDAISTRLSAIAPDLVCLCGYLRKLRMDDAIRDRTLNIHPALLPRHGGPGMYGRHVHESVLAAGDAESGCTVHWVDDIYDHGPIVLQRTCPVLPGDDPDALAARVFEQECMAYPEAIRMVAQGKAPRP